MTSPIQRTRRIWPTAANDRDIDGLSEEEAAHRLAAEGPNVLAAAEQRSWRHILGDAAHEPMFLLLVSAAVLYLILGELGEGVFLCLMVSATLGLTLYQEGKTERALHALRDLSSPRATVVRAARRRSIASAGLVSGDVIEVAEGDRVPADAVLLASVGMQLDESLLSGESLPIEKAAAAGMLESGMLYAGTLVVQGHGVARVCATGPRSQIGSIGLSLHAIQRVASPLQRQTAQLARNFGVLGMTLSAILVLAYGIMRGDWLQALLAGIALAMSMLPEELPVVMTVFPAIGAWRLARQHVLTRRLAAIETLGAVSVLCVDKTGTLTGNKMEVVALQLGQQRHALASESNAPLPPHLHELVEAAVLASAAVGSDPMDQAIRRLGAAALPAQRRHPQWGVLHEYGVNAERRALTLVWRRDDGRLVAAAKGAPETIANWCRLDRTQHDDVLVAADAMAQEGLRVLAVACAELTNATWPLHPEDLCFTMHGLLALADPMRPEIPAAVRQCQQAGIRVLMITGDHPETARRIAKQAGLSDGAPLTGSTLDGLDDADLRARIGAVSVCARVSPAQKLRLVQMLAETGAVVAMTGDGVNDAPALKAAHVGIAMGMRGTDVAREAAALVLLDDRFTSIVEAIRAGRRIYDNLRKSMRYIIAMHAPIAGMAILPILLGWPPLLYPMHIVFMELIIDPACSLVFENEAAEEDLMRRPPRDPRLPLFTNAALLRALAQGAAPLAAVAAAYAWALAALSVPQARAFGFAALVLANLSLILTNRAQDGAFWQSLQRPNPVLWLVASAAIAMLALVLYLPWLAAVFQFSYLSPGLAALASSIGLASGVVPSLFVPRRGSESL